MTALTGPGGRAHGPGGGCAALLALSEADPPGRIVIGRQRRRRCDGMSLPRRCCRCAGSSEGRLWTQRVWRVNRAG